MTVFCYAQTGKLKSKRICTAFAQGCGGTVIEDYRLRDGDAMVYGIGPGMEAMWRGAQDGRNFWLVDNAYFDASRETYFRVTRNRLQHSGVGISDGSRFRALGIEIKPWRTVGNHLLLCPQSEHFMRSVAGYGGDWTTDTMSMLRRFTDRPMLVRLWDRDKAKQTATLARDLVNAHALITWSSAAAITAILAGVPAVCAAQSAAWRVSVTMPEIEMAGPPIHDRGQWAAVLADQQFTVAEMANGTAWRMLAG